MLITANTLRKVWIIVSILILSPTLLHAQEEDELRPHYVKGDTLAFYADAFVLPEGAMLDRMLRKLPGVTYYSSGKVEIDGVTVKEIQVDNKTFFKNTMASIVSRLPAYAILVVKFYDYDQGKRMTVTLKKEFSGKWFADFSAAGGPDNRYSDKAFVMHKDKKLRLTAYANVNDINDSRQPGQETEWSPAEVAKNQRTTQLAGADYLLKKKKYDVTGYTTFNRTVTTSATETNRMDFLTDGIVRQNTSANGHNEKIKIDTYHDFHTMAGKVDIHVKPKFTYNSGDNETETLGSMLRNDSTLINDSRSTTSATSNDYTAGLSATASIKFDNKRKQIKFEAGVTNKGKTQDNNCVDRVDYYDASIDSVYNYRQRLYTNPNNHTDYYGKLGYIWLTKHTLGTVQYQYKHSHEHEAMEESGDTYGNSFDRRESGTYHEFLMKLRWGVNTRHGVWSANAYLPFSYNILNRLYLREDYMGKRKLRYTTFNVKNTYIQWRSNDLRHKATLLFERSTTVPDCDMMTNVTITTDVQKYYRGNEQLRNATFYDWKFNYTYLSADMLHEYGVQIDRQFTHNAIVNKLCFDRPTGRKLYTYDNINGNNATTVRLTLGIPLNASHTLRLHNLLITSVEHKASLEETATTTVAKDTKVVGIDDDFRLKYNFGKQYITFRTRFRMTESRSGDKTTNPMDWEYGLLGQMHLPWQIGVSTSMTIYVRRKYSNEQLNTTNVVWDMRIVRPFLNNSLLVVLEGFDLLHQLKHIETTIGANYVSTQRTDVTPSYAMACVVYRLNYNNKKYRKAICW